MNLRGTYSLANLQVGIVQHTSGASRCSQHSTLQHSMLLQYHTVQCSKAEYRLALPRQHGAAQHDRSCPPAAKSQTHAAASSLAFAVPLLVYVLRIAPDYSSAIVALSCSYWSDPKQQLTSGLLPCKYTAALYHLPAVYNLSCLF